MDGPLTDRRAFPRHAPAAVNARLRPAVPLTLQNLARGGALVLVTRALPPGGRVHVQLQCDGRDHAIVAQVRRCVVHALMPPAVIVFAAALAFDETLDSAWVVGAPDG